MWKSKAEDSNNQQELEITTPAGKFRARGGDMLQIIVLLMVGFLTFSFVTRQSSAVAEHKDITNAITTMADQQEQANYILTLTPEDRVKLRLEMPDGLRKRLRDRSDRN